MLANNFKRFKVITFDCTNTLFYFRNPPEVQYVKTAAKFGIDQSNFDPNLMRTNFRKQFKELNQKYPNFGRDSISYLKWWEKLVMNVFTQSSREPLNRGLLETVATKLICQFKTKECWGKFEKSNEIISALKDAGKTVGVISNFDPRLHELLLDMDMPKFDFVVTSYEAGFEKPNPEIFQHALNVSNMNIKPSECIHIGNEMEKDFKGAINAGWSAILINSEVKTHPRFENIQHFYDAITGSEIKL